MEEIKVNEYVRTKDGLIAQIINIIEEDYQERGNILYELDKEVFDETEGYEEYSFYALPDQLIKHSPNIIDLVKEEDIAVLNCYGFKVKKIVKQDDILELKLGNYELLEILTKEQFNQMKYIVGGE